MHRITEGVIFLNIISFLQIDGKWIEQEKISQKKVDKVVEDTMKRAGMVIGAEIQTGIKRRRAGN